MQNLIPKQLKHSKLEFFRGFTGIDILISVSWIGIDLALVFGIPLAWYIRVAIFVVILIFLAPLVFPMMGKLKGWQVILLWIKYKIQPKIYHEEANNNTSLLVPYDCVIKDKYFKTQMLDDYEYYVAGFEIKGFNLSLLSPETQMLKIRDLQDTFKAFDFPITMMKIELPLEFKETVNYYKAKINDLDLKQEGAKTVKNN